MRLLFLLAFCVLSTFSYATTFTVNSLSGTSTGTGTSGSLPYCINQANANPGPHTIQFLVSGTIIITTPLPALLQSITLDATTVAGYTVYPLVQLDGSSSSNSGLSIQAANCALYGLSIKGFPYYGIELSSAASNFRIGTFGKGNTIISNQYTGIRVNGADHGSIIDNRVGTSADGTQCAGNGYHGIDLTNGANYDTIQNNRISCNEYNGIHIEASSYNVVRRNLIGPTTGNCDGNLYRGIKVLDGSHHNIIGEVPTLGNLISGNQYWGVEVLDAGSTENSIRGNSFSCNEYGGIEINTGGNNNINPPNILTASGSVVSGTALPNAWVDIYKAQGTNTAMCNTTPTNQGTDYLMSTLATNSGSWIASGSFSGQVVAMQTDSAKNSSGFSNIVNTNVAGGLTNSCTGISVTTSLNHSAHLDNLVYPNPVSTKLNFSGSAGGLKKLYSITGGLVRVSTSEAMVVSDLVPGLYFLEWKGQRFKVNVQP